MTHEAPAGVTGLPSRSPVIESLEGRRLLSVTWDNLNPGAGGQIQDVVLDPSINNRAFLLSDVEGLYRTTDGGNSWNFVGDGLAGTNTLALAVDPNNSNRVYLGTTIGLHRSTNGGQSWSLVDDVDRDSNGSRLTRTGGNQQLAIGSVVVTDNGTIIAGLGNKRDSQADQAAVFVSTDGGSNFTAHDFGPSSGGDHSILQLAWDEQNDDLYAAVEDDGVWKSTNFGQGSWSKLSRPGGTDDEATGVAVSPDGSKVYATFGRTDGSGARVYGTRTSSISWQTLDNGLPQGAAREYRYLAVDPRASGSNSDRILVAEGKDRNGLYEASVTWSGGTPSESFSQVFYYFDARQAPYDTGWEGGVYGNQPRPLAYQYSPTSWNNNEIWTTGDQTLFKVNRGQSNFADKWQQIYTSDPVQTYTGVDVRIGTNGFTSNQTIQTYSSTGWESTVDFDADQYGDIVVSGKADHGVVMSWDGGTSWEDVSAPRISRSNAVAVIETSPGNVFVVAHLAPGFGANVNGGELWAYKVPDADNPRPGAWVFLGGGSGNVRGLPNVWYNEIVQDEQNPKRVYIATRDQGIFVIPDFQYFYSSTVAGQGIPFYSKIGGSPSTPDDKNAVLFVDPNDSRNLFAVSNDKLYKGRWNGNDASGNNLQSNWTWTVLRDSDANNTKAYAWDNNGTTYLAATYRKGGVDRVQISTNGGNSWGDAFDLADLLPVRNPDFDFSDVTPEIHSLAGDGNRVFAVVQKNAPENLGYGVFQGTVAGNGNVSNFKDITGDLPFPKSFNFKVIDDAKTGKKYLMFSSWGAGTWRADFDDLPGTGGSTPTTQGPFGGNDVELPGTVQAENYDVGGQGIAYNDSSAGNSGNAYRSDDVDVTSKANAQNGHTVGYTTNGEWLEYQVDVPNGGDYDVTLRFSSGSGSAGDLRVKLDGTTLGTFDLASTGGWNTFQTRTLSNVNLSAGSNKILRLEILGGAFDIDSIRFDAVTPPSGQQTFGNNGYPWSVGSSGTRRVQAENFDSGGDDVSYNENSSGNEGTSNYRPDAPDVDIANGNAPGATVGWFDSGEWLEYTVDVAQAGEHELRIRGARNGGGGQFRVLFDGIDKTSTQSFGSTGGWGSYQTRTYSVDLDAGTQVVRIEKTGDSGLNLDWFEIQRVGGSTGGGSGDVPWVENFDMPFGTTSDLGDTAWSVDTSRASISPVHRVEGNAYRLSRSTDQQNDDGAYVLWSSEPIDIGGGPVDVSLRVKENGVLESSGPWRDFFQAFYRVDGGPLVSIVGINGDRPQDNTWSTFSRTNITGSSLTFEIRGKTTSSVESYFFDDVAVNAAAGSTNSAADLSRLHKTAAERPASLFAVPRDDADDEWLLNPAPVN